MRQFWNDLATSSRVILGIVIFAAIFALLALMGGDSNFDYCHDRFYDQGFRGDDLVTLIESCLDNPGPGAPNS